VVYSIQIDLPSAFGFGGVSCGGFSGISCTLFSAARKLTITASNNSNLPASISIVLNHLTNPPIKSTSHTFSITSYDSFNYLIQSDTSTV
jgi:hypothetical protein